ncbi:hypothetical protein BGLA2_1240040 [Burkholderia gladioli]|nr:hypothetical protein BGLA2_1240040 [Burkholderia gladioli]
MNLRARMQFPCLTGSFAMYGWPERHRHNPSLAALASRYSRNRPTPANAPRKSPRPCRAGLGPKEP